MEPITASLLALSGVVALIVAAKMRRTQKSSNAEAARVRAKHRMDERAFMDTVIPSDDSMPYAGGIVCDDHGGLPLTAEQKRTIDLIYSGFNPPVIRKSVHLYGPSSTTAAGVPVSITAFDELNTVAGGLEPEYLAPECTWDAGR